ncbi:MAG: CNNM domain-containing protein [Gammaproteobacteria bacterium]
MADDISAGPLVGLLVLLLLISAFFSGSETALLTLNRYRLRHRARQGHLGARLAEKLLARPDRLISLILIGSNIANTLATSLVTLAALRMGGPGGVALASIGLAFVIMVFTDVMPKTVGALRSEQLGQPAAVVYYGLLKITWPVVWCVTAISNGLLRLFGVRADETAHHNLTLDELRTIVAEAGGLLPRRRQRMLMSILDLEDMIVDEMMIPDNELVGIDLDDDWQATVETITRAPHSRLPVFRGNVENLAGLLHLRSLVGVMSGTLDQAAVEALMVEPFFVPEGTSVHNLLGQFHRSGQRTAFVVDEYGDIQGMVTIEDILEEILGGFSATSDAAAADVRKEESGTAWVINAGINVRALNRMMHWHLPTDGPTTLNGLILEKLETIPEKGAVLMLNAYRVEILATGDNVVSSARITPPALATSA